MNHCHCWKSDSHSSGWEIPRLVWPLLRLKSPVTGPFPEPDDSSAHIFAPFLFRSVFTYSPKVVLCDLLPVCGSAYPPLLTSELLNQDRLFGLVVRVPGYRSRGPEFDSWRYQIFWEVVGLERGPLSLVRITEELLEWKSSSSEITAVGIRCADHATSLSAKVGNNFADKRRSLGLCSSLAE
jgi:hypothetical protein